MSLDQIWKEAVINLLRENREKIEDLESNQRILLLKLDYLEKKTKNLKKMILKNRRKKQ